MTSGALLSAVPVTFVVVDAGVNCIVTTPRCSAIVRPPSV
jgi:hypothetical protein